jgi:hypothetical protein
LPEVPEFPWAAIEPVRPERSRRSALGVEEVRAMSKETPKDDPRQRTDRGSHSQTKEPWKGNPEKEQQTGGPNHDLEKWQESDTH